MTNRSSAVESLPQSPDVTQPDRETMSDAELPSVVYAQIESDFSITFSTDPTDQTVARCHVTWKRES